MIDDQTEHLFKLTYQVLLKFRTPVMFQLDQGSITEKTFSTLTFAIPVCTNKYKEIAEYIRTEMDHDIAVAQLTYEKKLLENQFYPALRLRFTPIDGIDAYTEHDAILQMAESVLQSFSKNPDLKLPKLKPGPFLHVIEGKDHPSPDATL